MSLQIWSSTFFPGMKKVAVGKKTQCNFERECLFAGSDQSILFEGILQTGTALNEMYNPKRRRH